MTRYHHTWIHVGKKHYTIRTTCFKEETRAPYEAITLVSSWAIIILKLVTKAHNSKSIAFKVMPLALQLHFVMMCKYSKFGVDIFNIF